MKGPNILWICTDQQRYDTLSCYGNNLLQTKNLDRLADRGIIFDNAYCQNPLCTPSRTSFLTGRYPRVTRCRQNGQSIPADEVLVTKLLADTGYHCGLAGKLHVSACNPSVAPIMEARVDDGYSEFHWSHHPNENDPINWPTNEYSQWLRKKGLNHTTESIPDSKYVQTSVPAEYHQTTWCAEKAIDFIEHSALFPETPWLFSVNMFDPHHPFDPPKDYLERYMNILDQIPLPNYTEGELDNKPLPQQVEHHNAYCKPDFYPYSKMNDQDHRLIRAAYYAMIDLIDEQVGRIIDSLERTGQMENTLVIFMSDHGEMLGDHGIYLKGPHFYDPAVRVPLIISMPGTVKSGVRTKALVELVDLAPTLLEAAGLPMHPGMQGKSLWPLLRGELDSDFHRKDVYSEYYNSGFKQEQEEYGPFATMIRTDDHKLVVHHGLELGELYDLKLDPEETNNLWNDNDYMEVKLRLFKRLCDRMAWTVDPLPSRVSIW